MGALLLHPIQDRNFREAAAGSRFPVDCSAVVYHFANREASVEFWLDHPGSEYDAEISEIFAVYGGFGYAWPGSTLGVQRRGWPAHVERSTTVYLEYGEQGRLEPIRPAEHASSLVDRGLQRSQVLETDVLGLTARDYVHLQLWRAWLGLVPPNASWLGVEWGESSLMIHLVVGDSPGPSGREIEEVLMTAAQVALPDAQLLLGSGIVVPDSTRFFTLYTGPLDGDFATD